MAENQSTVLSTQLSVGPKGLGDPNDRSLRKVEKEILIPKLMRDLARKEKCTQVVREFENCCKNSSFLMSIKCRNENNSLKNCLTDWYNNEDFKKECQEKYLKQRSEYRRTGIQEKTKRMS